MGRAAAVFLTALTAFTALGLVGWEPVVSSGLASGAEQARICRSVQDLPEPVAEMRDAILAAAASGDVAQLRVPMEWNELPPSLGDASAGEPIAGLRERSRDGEGFSILAALVEILSLPCMRLSQGEGTLYVWPYLAELRPDEITPPQKVQLYQLISHSDVERMLQGGRYTGYRLTIGDDGVWHTFHRAQ